MATTTATRRLAAILAADVVGYSRLMGVDEEGTHERFKAQLRELLGPKIREHHGRVVKTTGDGVLAEFASVVDAVRCAGEIQHAMAHRDLDLAVERRLRFRIGINLGDVIVDAGDIYGDGVNIAVRLEGLAEPGSICISGTVRDHIGDRLPYAFEDMGERSVKNIARDVRVYALRPKGVAAVPARVLPSWARRARAAIGALAAAAPVIVCIAWWFWPAPAFFPTAGKPSEQATASVTPMPSAPATASISQPLVAPRLSIVVLPFANLSNDPDQQYFADGITEDLTTDLSRIPHMLVISRNTAFTYRNKPVDTKQIGRELGARYVLEGSVRRSGRQVRINAQLIDAQTDAHLWAERFDRDAGDLLALQNEITSRIAVALNVEVLAAEVARGAENNPDALDYILRGRAALAQPPGVDSYAEAIDSFEHALALDPQSIEAKGWLANALVGRVLDLHPSSSLSDLKRADTLASQAVAASPGSTLPHLAKGQLLRTLGRCEEAIPEFEFVIALDHNSSNALFTLGECKLLTGAIDEAIPLEEQAIRLGPRDPAIGFWYFRIGQAHLFQSRVEEAIPWFEKARRIEPEIPFFHAYLASAYALHGDTEQAGAELAEARRLDGTGNFSSIAREMLRQSLNQTRGARPEIRALIEATYVTGLREAGVPEE